MTQGSSISSGAYTPFQRPWGGHPDFTSFDISSVPSSGISQFVTRRNSRNNQTLNIDYLRRRHSCNIEILRSRRNQEGFCFSKTYEDSNLYQSTNDLYFSQTESLTSETDEDIPSNPNSESLNGVLALIRNFISSRKKELTNLLSSRSTTVQTSDSNSENITNTLANRDRLTTTENNFSDNSSKKFVNNNNDYCEEKQQSYNICTNSLVSRNNKTSETSASQTTSRIPGNRNNKRVRLRNSPFLFIMEEDRLSFVYMFCSFVPLALFGLLVEAALFLVATLVQVIIIVKIIFLVGKSN